MTESNTAFAPEPLQKLSKDLKQAAITMGLDEIRYLVTSYYQIQEGRIGGDHQVRQLEKENEPHVVLQWLADNNRLLEANIKVALDKWTDGQVETQWAKSIVGIGPVLAAGLRAHIDITKAPTVGHIWSFAGLNPEAVWLPKTRRPWNADLKTLCWKIGESFIKFSSHENGFYGKLWRERKTQEWVKNSAGEFSALAQKKLEMGKISETTDAYTWLSGTVTKEALLAYNAMETKAAGLIKKICKSLDLQPGSGIPMLAPDHIHARARRYAVKLFLSHYHAVAYRQHYGVNAPKPYVMEHLGHVHLITCPNWPWKDSAA